MAGLFEDLRHLPSKKKVCLLLYDVFSIQVSSFIAILLRFEFAFSRIPTAYISNFLYYSIINVCFTLILFYYFKLYSSVWEFADFLEVINIGSACIISTLGMLLGTSILGLTMPNSYYILYVVFLFMQTLGIRVLKRFISSFKNRRYCKVARKNLKKIMVVGVGEVGSVIIKEIMNNPCENGMVVCCIDDDITKRGNYIHGVKIIGGREMIISLAKKYKIDEIIIAMHSTPSKNVSDILDICKGTGCGVKVFPGINESINGAITVSALRSIEIEDLMGRDSIQVNLDEIMEYVAGKTIVVTGGGGSIGSELCRQIARYKPKKLIIIDIYENTTYEIQHELIKEYPDLPLVVFIASVRDVKRIEQIFREYRPDIVYHAAAHKHVPFMEDSPCEAIKNNVFGTYNVAKISGKFNVKRFILISTDKAVNPTNIMGASKRICEMIIQTMDSMFKTEFVAVRFGNVLGSNGSVIPLFKKQIEAGGPVTVTHEEIVRYFMTIHEAVMLVLQAGAYAKGGEIFILDMGEPVKIDELARNLIKLSGYVPDVDIKVVYTGLRPGEKLFEEKLMDEEGLRMTNNELIHVARPVDFDSNEFLQSLEELRLLSERNSENIKIKVSEIVKTYKPEICMPETTFANKCADAEQHVADSSKQVKVLAVSGGVAM